MHAKCGKPITPGGHNRCGVIPTQQRSNKTTAEDALRVPSVLIWVEVRYYADSVLSLMLFVHALSYVTGVVTARTRK